MGHTGRTNDSMSKYTVCLVGFLTALSAVHTAMLRVDGFQNSVYYMTAGDHIQQYMRPLKDSIFFDPGKYDFVTVGKNKKYKVKDRPEELTGNTVSFYRFSDDNRNKVPSILLFFTDDQYYKIIERTLLQKLTR